MGRSLCGSPRFLGKTLEPEVVQLSWFGPSWVYIISGALQLFDGRAVGGVVQIPGGNCTAVVSVYLLHGVGVAESNTSILHSVYESVTSSGLPWLVGGDFNLEPDKFRVSLSCKLLRGTSVHLRLLRVRTGGMRMKCYFLVGHRLSKGTRPVLIDGESDLSLFPCCAHPLS